MRLPMLTAGTLLLAFSFVGCNNSAAPRVESAEKLTTEKPDWKLVTLHIDGFKKSQSGGT